MYGLSAFCFVCLSMDKMKKLNEISDLSIFHILNSCSYDTKWMEDTFTMHICRKCHNQLYSVYEFTEMCRKNSSVLQGYVELLKQGRNDIAEPITGLGDRQMAKMEVVIDRDTVENKLEADINVNMVSANDTMVDPIRELSVKHELDAEQSFMNVDIDIKHEPLILNSDSESNHVQIIDKSDQETSIRNEKHCFADELMHTSNETPTACKNIKIEHIRDQNEILVTNVLDEAHNIKTQFSSHSEAIYINNIENNAVQNSSFNKAYLQNPIDPFERMCSEMQRRENDQNYKIQLPVFSNVNVAVAENSFNETICSTQNKVGLSGCELEKISDKMTSELTDNPVQRAEYNRKVKKSKKSPVPYSIDNMFYIMMPIVPTLPTLPVPNIPVMNPVPINNNNVVKSADNSIKNTLPLAATNNYVRNWKRKLEPPRKCDICQKTYDSHDGLRLHLVTHSGMKTVTPEKTPMQRSQVGVGINRNETFETMFIKHMIDSEYFN